MVLYAGMPRKLRIEYPGAMYHVMSRGDRREKIFVDDVEFSVRLNPVRVRMLKAQERLLSYPWSSFGA
jgi:REP element-mobilizing transposase RayT